MKRILLVLAVAALMAAMVVISALPAFASITDARAHACTHPAARAHALVCVD